MKRLLLPLLAFVLLPASLWARVEYIDDDALRNRLVDHLEHVQEGTNAITIQTLQTQLDRTGTVAKLVRPQTRERSWDEVYERVKPGVCIVGKLYKCGRCSEWHVTAASGFVISTNGLLVTNYHVVEGGTGTVMGALSGAGKFHAVREVKAANRREDVAILQLDGEGFTPLPVVADKPVGSPICVLSHPDGGFYSLTAGIISRYCLESVAPRSRIKRHNFVITADYAKGSSGAPVIDDCGNVVGLASSTVSIYYNEDHGRKDNLQQVIKYCVPAQCILDLVAPEEK